MKILILLIVSFTVFARDTIYLAPHLGGTYASSSEDAYASSLGSHIGITGGLRQGRFAFEAGIRRSNLDNDNGGNDDYDSELINDMYFAGLRIFLNDSFVFNGGLISHNLDTSVKKNGIRRKSDEQDGSYMSFYLGMGMQHELGGDMDIFWEGSAQPLSEVDIFMIEMTLGMRIYL